MNERTDSIRGDDEETMRPSFGQRILTITRYGAVGIALLLTGAICLLAPEQAEAQESFASPDLAIDALVSSVRSGTSESIMKVLGPDAKRIVSSGDPTADQAVREKFLAAYDEGHQTTPEGDGRMVLVIGKDEFPFPIPLVKDQAAWRFDAKAGEEEILNRRIGKNELSAVEAMRAYVDAQREYAENDRDGRGVQYAQKLLSTEGKKDGLYWPVGEGETDSPLGPLVAAARMEGYAARSGSPTPYHGYVFRILKGQGKAAAGGEMSYVVGGRMIAGYGLLAMPAEYGNSGVMSFIVNHEGIVFEKDLGPDTADQAARISKYDPDSTWTKTSGQ